LPPKEQSIEEIPLEIDEKYINQISDIINKTIVKISSAGQPPLTSFPQIEFAIKQSQKEICEVMFACATEMIKSKSKDELDDELEAKLDKEIRRLLDLDKTFKPDGSEDLDDLKDLFK
jgi:hypothetical protein